MLFFIPRHPIERRLLKSKASKVWNSLLRDIIPQETHGKFKNEFYNFKLSSWKESTLNIAPTCTNISSLALFTFCVYSLLVRKRCLYFSFLLYSAIFFSFSCYSCYFCIFHDLMSFFSCFRPDRRKSFPKVPLTLMIVNYCKYFE